VDRLSCFLTREHGRYKALIAQLASRWVRQGRRCREHPLTSGASGVESLFDDPEITINIFGINVGVAKTLRSKRKEEFLNKGGRRVVFSVDPRELRFQSVPRGCEEIVFGVIEVHLCRYVAVLFRQGMHQAEKKSRIRYFIQYCWTGRKCAKFQPKMRAALGNTEARPVPAPHCAVM
jgi:hypothetical protein